jgi:voltage-gated sodium channel
MKSSIQSFIHRKEFEWFISGVILVNCALIGVETYVTNAAITAVQLAALGVFTVEILLRWLARDDARSFFRDGWNVFDLSIVLVSLIPESLIASTSVVTSLRVLRVFRIFRLLRAFPELKLMTSVLIRSLSTLLYNGLFFSVFMYLFAVIGITLFRLPTPEDSDPQTAEALATFLDRAPNAPGIAPDPYGSLGETLFTLFRVLTGEDWTDLRYNLVLASEMGVIDAPSGVITAFHVAWFVVATFLLLNLLVGAILNNYQVVMAELKEKREGG